MRLVLCGPVLNWPTSPGYNPTFGHGQLGEAQAESQPWKNRRALCDPGTGGKWRSLPRQRRWEFLDCAPETNRRCLFQDETKLFDADAHMCLHRDNALGVGIFNRSSFLPRSNYPLFPGVPTLPNPVYLTALTNTTLGH